jgi:RimJ/RimL family protein N-acetyltransferase
MRDTAVGEKVRVRAYAREHVKPLHQAVLDSIPELPRYETWAHADFTLRDAADYVNWWRDCWSRKQAYYFAVEERDSGVFLGSCGLSDLSMEHRHAGLGFWIRQNRTNKGFATDAARVVMQLGFEHLRLNRIELEIAVDNAASRRIAEKLGCSLEGILRRRLILPAGPTDTAIYAILREDL